MGNKRISDYANETTIASTTEFLAEKSGGDYVALAWSIVGAIMPVGGIIMYGGASTPANFLKCDGTAISRTTYAGLYAVIGTTYGSGDGSTTFNLPNYQGVVPKGTGSQTINTRSKTGPNLGVVEEDRIQGHYHQATLSDNFSFSADNYTASSAGKTGTPPADSIQGPITDGTNGTPRTGATTRENSLGTNFYIRYQ